jgi:hypothetical protein
MRSAIATAGAVIISACVGSKRQISCIRPKFEFAGSDPGIQSSGRSLRRLSDGSRRIMGGSIVDTIRCGKRLRGKPMGKRRVVSRVFRRGLAIVLASVVAAAAGPRIPTEYRGEWCAIRSDEKKTIYKRCRDRYANEAGGIQVRARYFDGLETRHTPTKIIRYRNGHKIEGTWSQADSTDKDVPEGPDYWHLTLDGRYLNIVELNRAR